MAIECRLLLGQPHSAAAQPVQQRHHDCHAAQAALAAHCITPPPRPPTCPRMWSAYLLACIQQHTAHFIKTVEDIYEALIQSSPGIKFGVAFCEASPGYDDMPGRRVRFDGNDDVLIELAKTNAMAIGAGHSFIVFLGQGNFPVNVLNAIKAVPEVCRIHCATANPTTVVLAKTSDDAKVFVYERMVVCGNAAAAAAAGKCGRRVRHCVHVFACLDRAQEGAREGARATITTTTTTILPLRRRPFARRESSA